MGRAPCCEKTGLNKGPWSPEEDHILISYIRQHGHTNWRALPKQAGLLRCGKSCRLRWINYLRPEIKRGNFSPEEEETIIKLHEMLGNRWSTIAAKLPGRTDNEIKNVWHTHLKKRLLKPDSDSLTATINGDTPVEPTKKRARKTKVIKRVATSKNPKLEHVKCMDVENDHNDGYNNSNHSNSSNNNNITTNHSIDVARPISPIKRDMVFSQTCTSEMSTVTSTSASENEDNTGKENEEDKGQGDYFGDFIRTNENFWMEVLSIKDTTMSTEDLPCISQYDQNTSIDSFTTEVMVESSSKVDDDDVDVFWYNLLTRSDELLELSEIL